MKRGMVALVLLALASPVYAQLGGLDGALKKAQQVQDKKQQLDDLLISEDEERTIGEDVSAKIRERFGVVQDPAVHKYVTLVGTALAQQSERPRLGLDVHRARYRRGQRVRVARRLRPHHARRAGPDQKRSGAGRRARARDRPRRPQAHGQRDSEEQGGGRRSQSGGRRQERAARRGWPTRPTRWSSRTASIAATSSTPIESACSWP